VAVGLQTRCLTTMTIKTFTLASDSTVHLADATSVLLDFISFHLFIYLFVQGPYTNQPMGKCVNISEG